MYFLCLHIKDIFIPLSVMVLFSFAVKVWSCVPLPLLSLCSNEKVGWPKDNICIFSVPNM